MFGGDVVILAQILSNAVQQLIQLQSILSTGNDTFGLLREINSGVRNGLTTIQYINPKLNPGIYGNLRTADEVMTVISSLYGRIPVTAESKLQSLQDRSIAESIAMNSAMFQFADQVDLESKRIFNHSQVVSPQGAGKLTAQSIAVLIGVSSQVLRSNSMILKMVGQNLALENKRDKIESSQFKSQYDGLSSALGELSKDPKLQPLPSGG
jgi:hypothetical protein